jgi:hypothetical protein
MNASNFEITDGYVGGFGKTYKTATEQALAEAIAAAAVLNNTTADKIQTQLENGASVNWCKSPNYYYDHSYGIIRMTRVPEPVKKCRHGGTRYDEQCAGCGRVTDICNYCELCRNCHD